MKENLFAMKDPGKEVDYMKQSAMIETKATNEDYYAREEVGRKDE